MEIKGYKSLPSRFGQFTQSIFDEYSIYTFNISSDIIERYLPNKLDAFVSRTLINLAKNYFFYSKPIIFASRSQLSSNVEQLSDLISLKDFLEDLLSKNDSTLRYNFVITDNCLIFSRIPRMHHITYHLLCKHITLSNRSTNVRFAGEFWRDDDGQFRLNNNSGTYRPSDRLIRQAVKIFNHFIPELKFQGTDDFIVTYKIPSHRVDRYIMNQLNKLCIPAISQKNNSSKNERTSLILDHHRNNNSDTMMIDLTESDTVNMTSLIIDDVQELQTRFQASKIFTDIHPNKNDSINNLKEQVSLNEKDNQTASMSSINSIITEECSNVWDVLEGEFVNNNGKDNVINNDEKIIRHTTCTNEEHNNSIYDINKSLTTAFNSTIVEEMSTNDNMNSNAAVDVSNSVEYDYPTDDSMNIRNSDTSLQSQQQQNLELTPESSSLIAIEQENEESYSSSESNSIEYDIHSNLETTSSPNTASFEYTDVSKDMDETSNEGKAKLNKIFVKISQYLIALSKKLMLKPFIAFTNTDVTRLYNNAETKNRVIAYLKQNQLIDPINDLFVSNIPTKKTIKPEIGYLKMFPVSMSASEASSFETKLRKKVGIGLDEYVDKVLNNETSSTRSPIVNNIFNTAHHNWLLNRHWYENIKEGEITVYFQDKVKCPEEKISPIVVALTTVSNDDVADSFDQPRSNLTPSQRTNNELKRLGTKRQNQTTNEPP
ncbi:unnamed protein product, partial [Rotaria sordida]